MKNDTENVISDICYKHLSKEDQFRIEHQIKVFRDGNVSLVNSSSHLIFNWLFILNSGGLVALGGLFEKSNKLISNVSAWIFLAGLISVLIAISAQWLRFHLIVKKIDLNTSKLRRSEASIIALSYEKYDCKILEWTVNIFNIVSALFFIYGTYSIFSFLSTVTS